MQVHTTQKINHLAVILQNCCYKTFFMEDYTHYLICFENVGNGKKRRYFDLCKILRIGTNGKPYLEVKSKNGKVVKRYAESERLISIYEDC